MARGAPMGAPFLHPATFLCESGLSLPGGSQAYGIMRATSARLAAPFCARDTVRRDESLKDIWT